MRKFIIWSLSLCAMLAYDGFLQAGDRSGKKLPQPDAAVEIELFDGIQAKQLEVKVIALGSNRANVIIQNKTPEPVMVRLPEVFAAVPLLGQFGGQFGAGGGQGGGLLGAGQGGGQFGAGQGGGLNGGQGSGGQGLGGGFVGGQGGGGQFGAGGGGQVGGGLFGGGGGGRGMFRVEVDRPGKLQVEMVCLEHGKPDPNPRMKYTIVPLERLNADPKVTELCKLLAEGNVKQNIAQAAAWHIANGMTWDALAKKNRRESQYTGNEKYFTRDELRAAVNVTGHCQIATEQVVAYDSNSQSPSASLSTSTIFETLQTGDQRELSQFAPY